MWQSILKDKNIDIIANEIIAILRNNTIREHSQFYAMNPNIDYIGEDIDSIRELPRIIMLNFSHGELLPFYTFDKLWPRLFTPEQIQAASATSKPENSSENSEEEEEEDEDK
jgi:hypothetical protein